MGNNSINLIVRVKPSKFENVIFTSGNENSEIFCLQPPQGLGICLPRAKIKTSFIS